MTHALPAARFVCGQPITRVDGQLKVTGKAPHAADNQIPGLVYAALVCSTVACAGIDHVDTGAALRHRDVLRVLTDFTGMNCRSTYARFPTLASRSPWCSPPHSRRQPMRRRSSMFVTRVGRR
jgi:CO/xanthine dehydrogenase Mo-binding subunit